jgi:hypothetical protein
MEGLSKRLKLRGRTKEDAQSPRPLLDSPRIPHVMKKRGSAAHSLPEGLAVSLGKKTEHQGFCFDECLNSPW